MTDAERGLDLLREMGIEVRVDRYMPENMIAVLPKDPWHELTPAEEAEVRAAEEAAGAPGSPERMKAGFVALATVLGAKGCVAVARNVGTKLGLR